MSPIFHPNRQTVVMLPSSRRSVLVVVDYSDDPAAQPSRADVLLRVCRDKLDDAIAVGEAIIDLLHAGETAQWAASRPAAGLDAAIFGGPFGR